MRTLIIAEKPSVAKSIASALGSNNRCDGYFEGNGYYVSFAFGHLYTLADSKDYNPEMERWDLSHYPFIPEVYKYKSQDDPGMIKQIKIIKSLAQQSDLIVNACDGDREGELIFSEIKNDLGFKKPIKRLWISSHTQKDVLQGMANLKDDMLTLESAGYCRQQVDWMIGINLTTVYSLKAGMTLKVGRVVLPTLKFLFDRYIEIETFKPTHFYTLKSLFKSGDDQYEGLYISQDKKSKFASSEQLQVVQSAINDKSGKIVNVVRDQSKSNAPKLFNLTDLQGHITSTYDGFTSDRVLSIMQSLYERKYVTYPRTASRHLDNSQVADAEESLKAILNHPLFNSLNLKNVAFHSNKSVFDSSKVDSHPAIIPTYIVPSVNDLSDYEKIVYQEIAKRFIAQFMPSAVYNQLEILTEIESHLFITKGKVLVEEGWKALYSNISEEVDPEASDSITAKNIMANDSVSLVSSNLKEGITKAPEHHTEKSLLKAMETCGKMVENEEEVLKGFTIGTPATRGDTIKKLLDSGYIASKGKFLIITKLGFDLIHHFPIKRFLKVDFTGQIEKTLKDIEKGIYDPVEFMSKMSDYVRKNVIDLKSADIPLIERAVNSIGICPDCGSRVIENSKAYSCANSRQGCTFVIWKEDAFFKRYGKKMTEKIATEFCKSQKITLKGMKSPSKEGVKFDAIIKLVKDIENGKWKYQMEFGEKKPSRKGFKVKR